MLLRYLKSLIYNSVAELRVNKNIMKKAEFKIIEPDMVILDGMEEATMIPYMEGQIYHFVLSKELFVNCSSVIDGKLRKWTSLASKEGVNVSVTQLTRRNNGLKLTGTTIRERLESLITLFDENGFLTLEITKVIRRQFVEGQSYIYLKFQVI